MDRDPFRTLSVSYDAGPDAVRRAYRQRALVTHPDRGGSTRAFQEVRLAYDALTRDLESARRRWAPAAPEPRRAPPGRLDPATYPTCRVRTGRDRAGRRTVTYEAASRPDGWRPGAAPPPGGTLVARVPAADGAPAVGVWTVPLDAHRFRCVFGPAPAG